MHDTVLELGDRFAVAAVDNQEWIPSLKAMAEATKSARGQLIGFVPGAVPFNWINDLDQDEIARFVEHERGDPNVNVRVRASLMDSTFVVRSEADYQEVGRGPGFDLYREMCDAYDIPYGCQTKLLEGADYFVGLALNRSRKDGETDADTRALFAAIAPHVRHAVKTQLALEGRGPSLLKGAMEHVGLPVFLCDQTGIVVDKTSEAEALLSRGSFRIVERRIRPADPRESSTLAQCISSLATLQRGSETLILKDGSRKMPLVVDIFRLPQRAWRLTTPSQLMIIVRTGRRWHHAAPTILRAAFKLSPAEAEVALALAQGLSRDQVASERRTSVHTVKAQLKSIFAKMDLSRESELIAVIGDKFRV